MNTLKYYLQDWTDVDIAEWWLGVTLGLWQNTPQSFATEHKATFWTNNLLGDYLYEQLKAMAAIGLLEHDEEEWKFRWNPNMNVSDLETTRTD